MKCFRPFLFLLILSSLSIPAQDTPQTKTKATSGYYIVTYNNSDVNLELSINGYAIKEGPSNQDSSGQADINFWVIPGKNQLSFRLTERKPSKKKSSLPIEPKATINLVIGQQGQFPDEGEQILTYSWPKEGEENPKANGEWTNISFDPPFLPPSKLWAIAQTIEWSPELETSAILLLEDLTKALNSKDATKVSPFLSFREKDTSESRYYPADPASDKKALEGMMKVVGPTWKFNKKKIKATLICDKKIVSLTDAKGNSILNGKKDVSIPIYLSLVDGKWVISR
jgi:hypothetical protein